VQGVPQLAFLGKAFNHAIVFDVIVDFEMWGFINFKLEVFIPYFILAEILRPGTVADEQRADKAYQYKAELFSVV
jgi:hypothetical protein